jgi:hypothetical protein
MFILKIQLPLCKTYEAITGVQETRNSLVYAVFWVAANYPAGSIQHSEHGKSLKSRKEFLVYVINRRYAKNDTYFLSKSWPIEHKSDTPFQS